MIKEWQLFYVFFLLYAEWTAIKKTQANPKLKKHGCILISYIQVNAIIKL